MIFVIWFGDGYMMNIVVEQGLRWPSLQLFNSSLIFFDRQAVEIGHKSRNDVVVSDYLDQS